MNNNQATKTKGYQDSLKDSPEWSLSYGSTEMLAKKFNAKTMAEIGVARGHHSAHLLEAIPDLKVYSIDPWGLYVKEHAPMYSYHTLNDDEKIYQRIIEMLKPFGDRSQIIRSTSERAIDLISESLDMIFIDADHAYESVKNDIGLWWDKVKIGGIISGHDYENPSHPGVKKAVDEYFSYKGLKVNKEIGNVWWIQKPAETLSYIIPSYNAADFLEETVESIYKQNLKIPFEVIISDDCSADGTQELIKRLAAKHPEIRYFFNPKNLYAPANRNFAISQSKGDFIYMLDHDNVLQDNSMQKLIDAINYRGCGAASIQEEIFFKNTIDNVRGSWTHKYPNNLFTIREYITYPNSPAASNNYMYSRKAFNKTGGYPERGARENFGFTLRLLATGTKIAIVPETKYFHRILSNSMWWDEQKKSPQKGHENMRKIFLEFIDLFDEKSRKLILSEKSKKEADFYIEKHKINLSEKGWQLTGGREKYNFNNVSKNWLNLKYKINKIKNIIIFIKQTIKKIPGIHKAYLIIKNNLKNKKIIIDSLIFNFNNFKNKKIFKESYLFYKNDYLKNKNDLEKKASPFILPVWIKYKEAVEKYFSDNFSERFLLFPTIKETMFIKSKWQNTQLEYLEKKYKTKKLKDILQEDKFGSPIISSWRYQSSANSIHLFNHLSLFEDKTKIKLSNCKNIIEWGGGYGNMAKIFLRLNPNLTYSIIDLPIFIYIQAIYLSCILGRDRINIIRNNNQKIKDNCINLIPLNEQVIKTTNLKNPDVFISTWALSESNDFSQNLVEKLNFFNCQFLLIAHQKKSNSMPFADNLTKKIKNYQIIYHEKINYIGGENYYLFAKSK